MIACLFTISAILRCYCSNALTPVSYALVHVITRWYGGLQNTVVDWTCLESQDKLQRAFRQGLALPASFDVRSAELSAVPQWDSVAHLQLVVAMEDAFGVRLDPADVVTLNSYSSAIEILRHHGVWPDA